MHANRVACSAIHLNPYGLRFATTQSITAVCSSRGSLGFSFIQILFYIKQGSAKCVWELYILKEVRSPYGSVLERYFRVDVVASIICDNIRVSGHPPRRYGGIDGGWCLFSFVHFEREWHEGCSWAIWWEVVGADLLRVRIVLRRVKGREEGLNMPAL